MASQVEALYKYMTDNKLYNGSVNDFQRELSNPKTANSVFNYLSKNKLYTGDYKSFTSETNAYIETPATDDYSTLKSSVNKGLSFSSCPISLAVFGINCAIPKAPTGLLAFGLNLLS